MGVGLTMLLSILGIGVIQAGEVEVEGSKTLDDGKSKETLQGTYDTTQGIVVKSVQQDIQGGISNEQIAQLLGCGKTQYCSFTDDYVILVGIPSELKDGGNLLIDNFEFDTGSNTYKSTYTYRNFFENLERLIDELNKHNTYSLTTNLVILDKNNDYKVLYEKEIDLLRFKYNFYAGGKNSYYNFIFPSTFKEVKFGDKKIITATSVATIGMKQYNPSRTDEYTNGVIFMENALFVINEDNSFVKIKDNKGGGDTFMTEDFSDGDTRFSINFNAGQLIGLPFHSYKELLSATIFNTQIKNFYYNLRYIGNEKLSIELDGFDNNILSQKEYIQNLYGSNSIVENKQISFILKTDFFKNSIVPKNTVALNNSDKYNTVFIVGKDGKVYLNNVNMGNNDCFNYSCRYSSYISSTPNNAYIITSKKGIIFIEKSKYEPGYGSYPNYDYYYGISYLEALDNIKGIPYNILPIEIMIEDNNNNNLTRYDIAFFDIENNKMHSYIRQCVDNNSSTVYPIGYVVNTKGEKYMTIQCSNWKLHYASFDDIKKAKNSNNKNVPVKKLPLLNENTNLYENVLPNGKKYLNIYGAINGNAIPIYGHVLYGNKNIQYTDGVIGIVINGYYSNPMFFNSNNVRKAYCCGYNDYKYGLKFKENGEIYLLWGYQMVDRDGRRYGVYTNGWNSPGASNNAYDELVRVEHNPKYDSYSW